MLSIPAKTTIYWHTVPTDILGTYDTSVTLLVPRRKTFRRRRPAT